MPRIVEGAESIRAEVVSQRCEEGSQFSVLTFRAPGLRAGCRPGQFIMVRATEGHDPLLARPFAVFDAPADDETCVSMLYATVGRGTRIMSGLVPGDEITVLGPLGCGWRAPEGDGPCLLVGGGFGVAAVHLLARDLGRSRPGRVAMISAGADDGSLIPRIYWDDLAGVDIHLVTEDGSAGRKGLATDAAAEILDEWGGGATVFAAGPTGMMKAFAGLVSGREVSLQCSLEERMACGVGVCRGCVVKARSPHPETGLRTRTVCADGPVFGADEIDWEALR